MWQRRSCKGRSGVQSPTHSRTAAGGLLVRLTVSNHVAGSYLHANALRLRHQVESSVGEMSHGPVTIM